MRESNWILLGSNLATETDRPIRRDDLNLVKGLLLSDKREVPLEDMLETGKKPRAIGRHLKEFLQSFYPVDGIRQP